MSLNETIVEDATLSWFGELGYAVGHGPQLAPGEPAEKLDSLGEVMLMDHLRDTLLPKLLSGELSGANSQKVGHNPEGQPA